MAFMFENLEVYQKAIDFADKISILTEQFPRGYYFLVNQLNRAALSISTNIAEGNGRFTKADRKNFFIISRGSVQECVPLLELAKRRQFIDEQAHEKLRDELEILAKMLSGLVKGIDNRVK
ncbi:MAG: four helix bundle protein [Phycisphaerales bacterium]|jgi:four helix bundle protein